MMKTILRLPVDYHQIFHNYSNIFPIIIIQCVPNNFSHTFWMMVAVDTQGEDFAARVVLNLVQTANREMHIRQQVKNDRIIYAYTYA